MIVAVDALMTIGEFSDHCGLSPKVLRTYAEAGVLVPAVIDDSSGYRYYEPGQLAQAEIVRLLRQAGVAVSDIGRFLASPSRESLLNPYIMLPYIAVTGLGVAALWRLFRTRS